MAVTVRYVSDVEGLNVRSTASTSGSLITTLWYGDLMYVISSSSVTNGSYEWIKVHYYHVNDDKTTSEGEGWVALAFTTRVTTTSPSKSSIYCSSDYLNQIQSLTNARYIYKYLNSQGWSNMAIFATLGNMEGESTINPGLTEGTSGAYGLTQWDPKTKLTNWIASTYGSSADTSDIDYQLARILYEVPREGEQWMSSRMNNTLTFEEYTTSTLTCAELTKYFLYCYEYPSNIESRLSERLAFTQKWNTLIGCLI
ncbi:MAG: phage tail tip lysozyme [Lachnospiraceae bacterium]|nr:phage tail tip lysozyme [Lachnospiraceae bacterium]